MLSNHLPYWCTKNIRDPLNGNEDNSFLSPKLDYSKYRDERGILIALRCREIELKVSPVHIHQEWKIKVKKKTNQTFWKLLFPKFQIQLWIRHEKFMSISYETLWSLIDIRSKFKVSGISSRFCIAPRGPRLVISYTFSAKMDRCFNRRIGQGLNACKHWLLRSKCKKHCWFLKVLTAGADGCWI